jgi:hypothetical protein
MSYREFGRLCHPSTTSIISNSKYLTPFANDDQQVKMYDLNNIKLNSPMFLNNNQYPQMSSYRTLENAYEHFLLKILKRQKKESEKTKFNEAQLKDIETKDDNKVQA